MASLYLCILKFIILILCVLDVLVSDYLISTNPVRNLVRFWSHNLIMANTSNNYLICNELISSRIYKWSNLEYNKCISGFETTILMKEIRKYLVYEYVPIVEIKFRRDTRESCLAQRPIYIILNGNEETRSYINHVRNALSHLLFY